MAGDWFQVVLQLPEAAAEAVGAWLIGVGASGLEQRDQDHLEPPPGLRRGYVELRASFAGGEGLGPAGLLSGLERERLRLRAFHPGVDELPAGVAVIDPADWETSWRAHFRPVRVGRFAVHPPWSEPQPTAACAVCIDPGMAFGTGLHPTTRLCLAGLDARLDTGPLRSVLDVGCGSGVLGLAAARAGVERVVAVDTDPLARQVARGNCERNGLADRIEIAPGELAGVDGEYDLVLANILSGVLIGLAAELARRTAPGGGLVLSGILDAEVDQVAEAYAARGLRPLGLRREAGWAAVDLEAPGGGR